MCQQSTTLTPVCRPWHLNKGKGSPGESQPARPWALEAQDEVQSLGAKGQTPCPHLDPTGPAGEMQWSVHNCRPRPLMVIVTFVFPAHIRPLRRATRRGRNLDRKETEAGQAGCPGEVGRASPRTRDQACREEIRNKKNRQRKKRKQRGSGIWSVKSRARRGGKTESWLGEPGGTSL